MNSLTLFQYFIKCNYIRFYLSFSIAMFMSQSYRSFTWITVEMVLIILFVDVWAQSNKEETDLRHCGERRAVQASTRYGTFMIWIFLFYCVLFRFRKMLVSRFSQSRMFQERQSTFQSRLIWRMLRWLLREGKFMWERMCVSLLYC